MVDLGSVCGKERSEARASSSSVAPGRAPSRAPQAACSAVCAASRRSSISALVFTARRMRKALVQSRRSACGSAATSRRRSRVESPASSTPIRPRSTPWSRRAAASASDGEAHRPCPRGHGQAFRPTCVRWRSRAPRARTGRSRRRARQLRGEQPCTARIGRLPPRVAAPRLANAAPTRPPGRSMNSLVSTSRRFW